MSLLTVTNLVKEYGGEAVTKPLTFSIEPNDRIALIGKNGCGKTTLIKMLIGEILPDKGSFSFTKGTKVGYLSQTVISSLNHTLYEEAEDAFKDIMEMEEQIHVLCDKIALEPSNEALLASYSKLEQEFRQKDGYNYRYKINLILNYFNFRFEDYERPITSFSGGERMKLAFAKLLLSSPDILILDEPTNHLDVSTIDWLENYLKTYKGAIFFVSHDRYFISTLANKIYEIENDELCIYNGDYDYYTKEKRTRYESQLKQYFKEEKEKKKLEWFIQYYMPKPRFVSRAHDREKKLARLMANKTNKPHEEKNHVHIRFEGGVRQGKRVFAANHLTIGYDDPLISDINFLFLGGEHLAIMGDNGSGKTTFIKTLLRKIKPLSGSIDFYGQFSIGYLPQDGLLLKSDKTIFEYIRSNFPALSAQEIYNELGAFDFNYEDDQKIIDTLSGGEMMRVVLATLVLKRYDVLIMDEPTNHLDMFTKTELISALKKYKGSLILISHDREFIDDLSDKLLFFYNKKYYYYEGNYSGFKEDILEDIKKQELEELNLKKKNEPKKVQVTLSTQQKLKRRKPSLTLERLEKKIQEIEDKHLFNVNQFSNPEVYSDSSKLQALEEQNKKLESDLEKLYDDLAYYLEND